MIFFNLSSLFRICHWVLQACGDTNDACLCSTNTTTDILDCEQCMFNQLVLMNMKQPSPLVGNNVVVGGKFCRFFFFIFAHIGLRTTRMLINVYCRLRDGLQLIPGYDAEDGACYSA